MAQKWAVTRTAMHLGVDLQGPCAECLALTSNAITYARATGSSSATYETEEHSVTVVRAITVVEG